MSLRLGKEVAMVAGIGKIAFLQPSKLMKIGNQWILAKNNTRRSLTPTNKTCVRCAYYQTCPRTDPLNLGKDDRDYPEMLRKKEADIILDTILTNGVLK